MARTPTERQKAAINELSGLCTVRACPGSGKTWTVSVRLLRLLSAWSLLRQGIATLSFTNIAWQEIQGYLTGDCAAKASSFPHFLGTIDHFINTFVFLPFGHLVMGSSGRPTLTGPPHDDYEPIGKWLSWGKGNDICHDKGCQLNDLTHRTNGQLIHTWHQKRGAECPHNPRHPCVERKKTFNRKGYATQTDANYFALKVLQRYPQIAAALAIRFPVVMVDECQDTSRVQMAILDLLVTNGVNEMMLIGDPDQAIYEWRQAEPRIFLEKCEAWRSNSVQLVENWRSSQHICSVASVLSSSEEKIVAANPDVAGLEVVPAIWGYQETSELPTLAAQFVEKCRQDNIPDHEVCILTRGKELLNEIKPGTTVSSEIRPWSDDLSAVIGRAKYLYDLGEWGNALRIISRSLAAHLSSSDAPASAQELRTIIDRFGFCAWRAMLRDLLRSLPAPQGPLLSWVISSNEVLSAVKNSVPNIQLNIKRNSAKCRYSDLTCEQVFGRSCGGTENHDPYLGTVYSVKGKTLEAVMLVLKRKGAKGPFYVNSFDSSLVDNEEMRIVYVGLTRPRKSLVLAVPIQDVDAWGRHLGLS